MNKLYHLIRPLITKGDIQNRESVSSKNVVQEAMELETAKYSNLLIMNYFYHHIHQLIGMAITKKNIKDVLDVGSATGEVIAKIALEHPPISFKAIDIMQEAIDLSQKKYFSLRNLSFQKIDFIHDCINKFDLILCLQTLEHIEDKFIRLFCEKIFSGAKNAVIVSVPHEPYWCLANILRLKYWSRMGNTPHHIQHWTQKSFKKFIAAIAREKWGADVEIISVNPLNLWTMVLLINQNP